MLSAKQIAKIRAEVKQAAIAHLNAKDLDTALSHFTDDVIAVSNNNYFSSRDLLAAEIGEFYRDLKKVNIAAWDDIHIHVISEAAATFAAKFVYGFTSTNDQVTMLEGVWTALFVLENGDWKIRLRHESFVEIS